MANWNSSIFCYMFIKICNQYFNNVIMQFVNKIVLVSTPVIVTSFFMEWTFLDTVVIQSKQIFQHWVMIYYIKWVKTSHLNSNNIVQHYFNEILHFFSMRAILLWFFWKEHIINDTLLIHFHPNLLSTYYHLS